jgi:hypothetical protein
MEMGTRFKPYSAFALLNELKIAYLKQQPSLKPCPLCLRKNLKFQMSYLIE